MASRILQVKGVSASSNDGNLPQNVTDGNTATRWSAQGKGQWIQLDLGAVFKVQHVQITWHQGSTRSNRFSILGSKDLADWKTIFLAESTPDPDHKEVYNAQDMEARYIKVVVDGSNEGDWASITEIDVYGDDLPGSGPAPEPQPHPEPEPQPEPQPQPQPQPEPQPQPVPSQGVMKLSLFSKHSRSPLLLGHPEADIINVNNTFYMFYRNDNTGKASIGLMTSANGLDWVEKGTVFSASASGFDSAEVIAPSVLFENGIWYMWYESDDAANVGRRKVGLATAQNPQGPWTREGIALEGSGGWEGSLLGTPAIAKIGNKYCLFYHGYSNRADRVGVAYSNSPRGPWVKEQGNPILDIAGGGSGNWDCCKVAPSSVIPYGNEGRFLLFYEGWNGIREHIWHWRVGIADGQLGTDGRIKPLTRRAGNPVINLNTSGTADSVTAQLPAAIKVGNQIWCYYSGNNGSAFRLCLATAEIQATIPEPQPQPGPTPQPQPGPGQPPETWINWVRAGSATGPIIANGGSTHETTIVIDFQGTVAGMGSHIELKVDNKPYVPVASRHTVSGLAIGPHTLSLRAVNQQGQADPTPATWSFSVEGQPEPPPVPEPEPEPQPGPQPGPGTIPNFIIGSVGDSGMESVTKRVSARAVTNGVQYFIHLGDMSYGGSSGDNQRWWNDYYGGLKNVPSITTRGNHDGQVGGSSEWPRLFKLPGGNWRFSTVYQNVLIISIDSDKGAGTGLGGDDHRLLEDTLKRYENDPKIKWRIVIFHHPMYTPPTNHSPENTWQRDFHPIFDKYKVDFVLYGHNHNYFRSFPMRWNGSVNRPFVTNNSNSSYSGQQSPIFMQIGSGGRNNYGFGSKPSWSTQQFDNRHGYGHFAFSDNGTKVTYRFIADDGSVHDTFVLSKGTSSASLAEPAPRKAELPPGTPPPQRAKVMAFGQLDADSITYNRGNARLYLQGLQDKSETQLVKESEGSERIILWPDNILVAEAMEPYLSAMTVLIRRKIKELSDEVPFQSPYGALVGLPATFKEPNIKPVRPGSGERNLWISDCAVKPVSTEHQADIAFLRVIDLFTQGQVDEARRLYDETTKQWDGKGIADNIFMTDPRSWYSTAKLALWQIAAKRTGFEKLPVQALMILGKMQMQNGGFVTHYNGSLQPMTEENVMTTALAMIAFRDVKLSLEAGETTVGEEEH